MDHRIKIRRWILPGIGILLVAAVWLGRASLREHIRTSATLANNAPTPEVVTEMIEQARDPHAALLLAWHSGKIVHRETAIHEISQLYRSAQTLPPDVEEMLLAAALDPDMNVRELAFGLLQSRKDPALTALAAAQLRDADTGVRLLGLNYLRSAPGKLGMPLAAGMLDDPDLRVTGASLKLMEQWSGESFGAKLADAVPVENPQSGLMENQAAGAVRIKSAMDRARSWWQAHQAEYPPVKLPLPPVVLAALPAAEFQLHTLEGITVRLSDFRGQVVLVNFWTTWCTACVSEMPELVALQKEHAGKVVILGVSLDYLPDDDGDRRPDPATLPKKIARAIQQHNLNYPVLLDINNDAGGCYNGGELPTTVLVDAQGNVRRRFVGARSLKEFEAMIAEASEPLAPVSTAALAHPPTPSGMVALKVN